MEHLNKFLAILHKWKPHYTAASILLIVATFFRMLEPKILQVAIDGVLVFFQSNGTETPTSNDFIAKSIYALLPDLSMNNLSWVLICLGIFFLVISLIRSISRFSSSTITAHATEKATKRLRDNLFSHIQRLPLSKQSELSTGEMIQRCTGDVDTVHRFIGTQVVDIVWMSSIFFISFYMMASVHLLYAFIAIALVPFISLTSYLFFSKEAKVWKEHEAEQDKLTSITEENLAGIRVVQAFAQEAYEKQKFETQNQKALKVGLKRANLHALFWPFSDMLVSLQVTLSVVAGGYFALTNQITVGELVSFYTYAIMVTWPMRRLGRVISQTSMAVVAIDRLSAILDSETEDYGGVTKEDGLKGEVEFKNVWFKYAEKDESYVLKDVSFKIKAGQIVALIGETGSGKTTIINLLVRFYEPTKGAIFIDGINIKEYSKTYLRKCIGVVLQQAFLFSTSIKNNIAYANLAAEQNDILQAAKDASIHEILDVFSDGYNTVVGEKGVTLSGGQRQRVALARTLLENPDILVLDDTTSAVDTETEYDIQQALVRKMQGITTFIIAHRISAIQHADVIIVLKDGQIVEQGTPQELQQNGGFYQQIYDVQTTLELDVI